MSAWDIRDDRVLAAMRSVPRSRFVPPDEQLNADGDFPLPIGCGQTISQPYIVAYMTEKLDIHENHRVLEIGTGSGYQAAILAELAGTVYSVERIPELAEQAAKVLVSLDYTNIEIKTGDGRAGWTEKAPFDRIIVTAAAQDIPERLTHQLVPGGRMIIPVGPRHGTQVLLLAVRQSDDTCRYTELLPVRFVPLI